MSIPHLIAAADPYAMSVGRLGAIVAALTALAGAITGGLALARSTGRIGNGDGDGRNGARLALTAAVIGTILGGLVAVTSDGSLGTGNGLGGALVALLVGLIGMTLGGLALGRARGTG
ncbi:DUF6223 family protein [Spirillospora sp. CA-108201]